MKKFVILILFLFTFCSACASANKEVIKAKPKTQQTVIQRLYNSAVSLVFLATKINGETERGMCTGVVIKGGYVLTAGHCAQTIDYYKKYKYAVTADWSVIDSHRKNRLIPLDLNLMDTRRDLAVFEPVIPLSYHEHAISFATKALKVGERVCAIMTNGAIKGLDVKCGVVARALVTPDDYAEFQDRRVLLQMPMTGGSSGGPVFNMKGELVGLIIGGIKAGRENVKSGFVYNIAAIHTIQEIRDFLNLDKKPSP